MKNYKPLHKKLTACYVLKNKIFYFFILHNISLKMYSFRKIYIFYSKFTSFPKKFLSVNFQVFTVKLPKKKAIYIDPDVMCNFTYS